MDVEFTEEQRLLRDTVRGFVLERAPESEVRKLMETDLGFDPAVWAQFSRELGLGGLFVPEAEGGVGLGMVEAGIVMEELGRGVFSPPFLSSSIVAASALLASGDAVARSYLPRIADGGLVATLATLEAGSDWRPEAAATRAAREDDDMWSLTGAKECVLDGLAADLLLVTARPDGADRIGLFAVDATATRCIREPAATLDMTRKLARVRLDGARGRLVGEAERGNEYVSEALAIGCAALGAEQLGAAEHCLESAVGYVNVREQFGTTIGTFQSVQHRCADMLVEIEAARSAVELALWAAGERSEGWIERTRMAKIVGSEALNYVAAENLHLHGGNGFSWEFGEHLYFRRARSSALLYGAPAFHRDELARALAL